MTYFIEVTRVPYEEPYHVELHWHVSNGNTSTKFEYYHNATSIRDIGDRLVDFPKSQKDKYEFVVGSENPMDRFAYYFRFEASVQSLNQSTLFFRFNNNDAFPYKEVNEFCIQTDPRKLNELGKLFLKFSKLDDESLYWSDRRQYVGSKIGIGKHPT